MKDFYVPLKNRFACRNILHISILCILLQLGVPSFLAAVNKRDSKTASHSERMKGIDLDGRLHDLGIGSSKKKAIVLVFLSTECPISNGYLPRLNALADQFKNRGAQLFGVISDSSVTRAEAIAHRKKYGIHFPVLFDASGELLQKLRPTHVPQAFVLSVDAKVVYSGLIDDEYAAIGRKRAIFRNHYLSDAVQAVTRGRLPKTRTTQAIGCLIEGVDEKTVSSRITYCRDIAPIIQAHCATCHRPGEAAPFPLLSFKDVAKRSRQIVAVTSSRLMPPWKPEPGFGHFRDERRLSKRELKLIADWSQGGKSYGNSADLPPTPIFSSGWQLGKPDLILRMPREFQIPAKGPDILQHFVIPTGLTENRLVAAVEFRPGNPRVAHHCAMFLDTNGAARKLDAASNKLGYNGFGGPGFIPNGTLGNWLPGSVPQRLPVNSGRLLPRGADLVLQMHYQRTGKAETDRSTIGIFFAPRSARRIISEFQVMETNLRIPAGVKRFHHRATYILPVDIMLFDAAPHMHLLGREMKVTAISPGGKTKPLIWIRDWDFNWQGQYTFSKPIRLRRGTKIIVDSWLDNSTSNKLNPNSPLKDVLWGEQTTDEMPLCQFRYTTRNMRDFWKMQAHYLRFLHRELDHIFPAAASQYNRGP